MNENNFKPFQQVLVRDGKNNEWMCDFYSHYDNETEYHFCVGGRYECCIPYDGNEELLGTTDVPQPKRWRAKDGESYWVIAIDGTSKEVCDTNDEWDNRRFEIGNYFRSREEAEEMAVKFRALLVKAMMKGE